MKNLLISILYVVIGVIAIILLEQPSFYPGFTAKALIIPVLVILFILNLSPFKNNLHWLMIAALFFSWAGDITLEFTGNNENYFMIGLACFLLAQVMYLVLFILTPGNNSILGKRIYLLLPVLLYGLVLVSFLYNDLGEMRIPVIVYAVVILSMLTGAINRKDKVNKISFYVVLAGAILFVISDSAIAIAKFSYHFDSSGIVIMSTYIIAQYCIVRGYILQFGK